MNWEVFKKMKFKQQVFVILIIIPIFYLFILPILRSISSKIAEKKKYKKVIKKGFFWDTEYLIEKD